MARPLVVAIDGPAGAGKSTIAKALAARFGLVNLETGAMYRSLALKAIESGAALDDESALVALAGRTRIELQPTPEGNRVLVDGRDVTERLRASDVTQAASKVSVHPQVRADMVARQRRMGADGGVVMEGRDIGTVVFPDAEVKIFLMADARVRAERRVLQQGAEGDAKKARQLTAELLERDKRDTTRAEAPLRAATDAVVIDSTAMTLAEVVARAIEIVAARQARD